MAFKRIVRDRKFWVMVVVQGLVFTLIYQIIAMLFEYGGFDFGSFYQDKLSDGRWIRFLIGVLLAAFLYGFIISYGQFRTRIKREQKNE